MSNVKNRSWLILTGRVWSSVYKRRLFLMCWCRVEEPLKDSLMYHYARSCLRTRKKAPTTRKSANIFTTILFFSLARKNRKKKRLSHISFDRERSIDAWYYFFRSLFHTQPDMMARGTCTNILFLVLVALCGSEAMEYRYHNYTEMTSILQNLAAQYPTKASLVEVGKSEAGRPMKIISDNRQWYHIGKSLWAMALSAYAPDQHILLRPEVKYIGNMHGNEVVGLEVLLYLIEYLLTSNDTQAVRLMNQSRIWIMPSMNPDGLANSKYGDCTSTEGRSVA